MRNFLKLSFTLTAGSEHYTHVLFSQHHKYNQLSHVTLKARPHHAKSRGALKSSRTINDLSVCIWEPAFSNSYSRSFKKWNLPYTSRPVISNQINDVI